MQYTDNYSLRKPQMAETASVSDINYNTDRIDAIMTDNRQISVDMYVSGNTYNTGDLVGYENPTTHHIKVYRCLVDNVTGTWDSTKWTITNLSAEILDAKQSGGTEVIPNPSGTAAGTLNTVEIDNVIYAVGGDSANQNIADAFSTSATYAVGDYCIYESILYKCTTAVTTAGAWDSTKWESCVVTDEMGSGGGATYNELTQLEYDALTPAEKKNGEMYFITDTNGDGSQFQPVIYSTDEREIGVWIDGKPLYQKTFTNVNVAPAYNLWTNIIQVSDIDNLVSASAISPLGQNIEGAGIEWSYLNGYIKAEYNNNANLRTVGTLTIQYTKTTDTAGSGTWTPQGVPAVHYSEDEHIVGTWIDGSTIYEKTVDMPSITLNGNSNSWTDTGVPSPAYGGTAIWYTVTGGYGKRVEAFFGGQNILVILISRQNVDIDITGYKITVQYTKSS